MVEREIYFANNYSHTNTSYFLFELTDELIDSLSKGNKLKIKGRPEEEAYLCSHDCTYMIRKQETTNTLLLLSDSYIQKSAFGTYSTVATTPQMHQLRDLLYKSPYNLRDTSNL